MRTWAKRADCVVSSDGTILRLLYYCNFNSYWLNHPNCDAAWTLVDRHLNYYPYLSRDGCRVLHRPPVMASGLGGSGKKNPARRSNPAMSSSLAASCSAPPSTSIAVYCRVAGRLSSASRPEHPLQIQNEIGDLRSSNYDTLDQVKTALEKVGLESSNLIIGVDFTKSNEWTGKHCFNGRSLHHISEDSLNPYEQAISIIGRTLSTFDEDNRIPCFGFGDTSTHDRDVFSFSFYSDRRQYCNGVPEVLRRYREITPHVRLSGPTSLAPIIETATRITQDSGYQYHILLIIADGQVPRCSGANYRDENFLEARTRQALVQASHFPLSIVLVGVGDGPWDEQLMHCQEDGQLFDNFQFVDFTKIMSREMPEAEKEEQFALEALEKIPSQYAAIVSKRISDVAAEAAARMPVPPPPPRPVISSSCTPPQSRMHRRTLSRWCGSAEGATAAARGPHPRSLIWLGGEDEDESSNGCEDTLPAPLSVFRDSTNRWRRRQSGAGEHTGGSFPLLSLPSFSPGVGALGPSEAGRVQKAERGSEERKALGVDGPVCLAPRSHRGYKRGIEHEERDTACHWMTSFSVTIQWRREAARRRPGMVVSVTGKENSTTTGGDPAVAGSRIHRRRHEAGSAAVATRGWEGSDGKVGTTPTDSSSRPPPYRGGRGEEAAAKQQHEQKLDGWGGCRRTPWPTPGPFLPAAPCRWLEAADAVGRKADTDRRRRCWLGWGFRCRSPFTRGRAAEFKLVGGSPVVGRTRGL
ncbi:hypothetical protein E2562_036328 [Oryza meyeriana var. granulata]|uniref:VWFA domain-containing protein n=1 Tax=Oryza meyeriana var. granulata TaxID=110450 RepID=A0A6G1DRK0_9ORYZ|nr:hypothetical protein E2562_036328 [Oryza meyeriana var. granulata]